VTFLPGGLLAVATMELAAGQMVSGASRLVSGVVQLALLAVGIVAGAALVHAPKSSLLDHQVAGLGYWAAWLGVFVFAFGVFLHFSAPARSLPWLLLVLVVAFAGQSLGSALFGGELSGFFGALAMTPLALWVERLRRGPPKLVTFLPAFWLLVPGATGLIGVTAIVGTGTNVASSAFSHTLGSIIAISLGVLIGAALFNTTNAGAGYLGRAVGWPHADM
jgi:X-X-X-Leu-X-X-Gly heptad repeat protein